MSCRQLRIPFPSAMLAWLVFAAAFTPAPSAQAAEQGLTAAERRLMARVEANQAGAVELLQRAVDQPSATENLAGVRAVGAIFAAELAALGFETRWVGMPPEVGRAGHLVAEHPAGGTAPKSVRGRRLLLIGHLDTVLEGEPFRREGDRAYGSGVSDMKGGDVVKKDETAGMTWLLMSANQGAPQAQYEVGISYWNGLKRKE